jgi:peptidoglycan/xylan/chitin deacetylase (PgdA/CDA1 family)
VSRPLVLCYHAVSDEWQHQLAVTREAFEGQLRSLLRRRFRPAGAAEAVAGRGRLLHVTFDDAYRSVAAVVPVMERLGIRATVFAATGFADAGGRPLDVPELADEAAAHPDHMATMNWEQLHALVERGVEVGSHTVSHPHLPRLGDAEIDRELTDARARLEDEFSRPCRYLAYPYGESDARVHAAARRAGYDAAFMLQGGADRGNRYALPRVDLYRRDTPVRATLKTSFVKPLGSALLELAGRSDSRVGRA